MKAQVSPVLGMLAFVFFGIGAFYQIFVGSQALTAQVEANTGAPTLLTEASTRGEIYAINTKKEMNYSSNKAAIELGENSGGANWNNNIPSIEQLRSLFITRTSTEITEEVNMLRCSPPIIGNTVLIQEDPLTLRTPFEDPFVKCESRNATANVDIGRDRLEVKNTENRYLQISRYAIRLGEEAEELSPDNTITGTGTYTGGCGISRNLVRTIAKSRARFDARQKAGYRASDAVAAASSARPPQTSPNPDTNYITNIVSSSASETVDPDCSESVWTVTVEVRMTEIQSRFNIVDGRYGDLPSEEVSERINFDFTYIKDLN